MPHYLHQLGHGIYAVDTGFQREQFDAAYLIVQDGRAAFIDCGTNHAVPRLLGALTALGLAPEAVDWLIPTHVHLDHAGGAGLLMQQLPAARLLVHPRGLRHLVDPSFLYAGALLVYGQAEMDKSYGRLLPIAAERVQASADGQRIQLAGRELLLLDTPGHARHHHCIWDASSRGWFTGDTFGLSYREFDVAGDTAQQRAWILPASTPVQFDPEALAASVARLLSFEPEQMFLTHYSRIGGSVGELRRLADLLLAQAGAMVGIAQRLRTHPQRHLALKDELLKLYLHELAHHGCTLPLQRQAQLLAMDVELNAQGLGVWLERAPS